jgi:hypothetical protein
MRSAPRVRIAWRWRTAADGSATIVSPTPARVVVYQVGSVGEQTAVSGIVRKLIDRRYVVSSRRQDDLRAMHGHEWTRHDHKAPFRLAPKGDDGRFDLCVAVSGRSD